MLFVLTRQDVFEQLVWFSFFPDTLYIQQ